jgi:hypothetical protein
MKPSGAHTHPELRGSGGRNGWLIVLGAIVLTAFAGPVAHAISDLIQVLAITLAVVLAVASLAAILTCWIRHKNTRLLIRRAVTALQAPDTRSLGRAQEVHLHFHAVSAEDVASIIARQDLVRGQPGSLREALGEARE